jgi:hypothetical protein
MEVLAERVEESDAGVEVEAVRRAVDVERDGDGFG